MFKKTIQLFIILCVLAVIFYLVNSKQRVQKEVPFFGFDSTQVARIDISSKNDKVIILKNRGKWELSSPIRWEVSEERIQLFFSKALKVKVTKSPVSEDIKNQAKYRVTPDRSIILSMYDKQSKLLDRVFLGKSLNSSFCYARRPGSNAIYQLKDNIYDDINPSIFMWRSPIIAKIILPNLIKVEVKYSGYKYRMILDQQEWFYENPTERFKLDPTNLATGKFFNALGSLQSYQFIDNRWTEFEKIFKVPAAEVTVTDKYGKITKLTFAVSKENMVYLMKNDDTKTLYMMSTDMLNRFTLSAQHFKP